MTVIDIPEDLTGRQREVLELWNQEQTPTEIGKALGITSQGVHGHLRRLANRGLVTLDSAPPRPAQRRPARGKKAEPAAALEAVRRTAREQDATLLARLDEIEQEIKILRDEKKEIDRIRQQLEAHLS